MRWSCFDPPCGAAQSLGARRNTRGATPPARRSGGRAGAQCPAPKQVLLTRARDASAGAPPIPCRAQGFCASVPRRPGRAAQEHLGISTREPDSVALQILRELSESGQSRLPAPAPSPAATPAASTSYWRWASALSRARDLQSAAFGEERGRHEPCRRPDCRDSFRRPGKSRSRATGVARRWSCGGRSSAPTAAVFRMPAWCGSVPRPDRQACNLHPVAPPGPEHP